MKFLYKKRKNSKISVNRREELIQSVVHEGKSITYAAKKLRLKYSTARIIVNKYQQTGEIFVKDMHRKPHQPTPEPTQQSQPSQNKEVVQALPDNSSEGDVEINQEQIQNNCVNDTCSNMVWFFYPYCPWGFS